MKQKDIGKTCPYCKTLLLETDDIVFCSTCEMPHHRSCWQANGGCTTFGCTGSMFSPGGQASTPPRTETPVSVIPADRGLQELYSCKDRIIFPGAQIVLESVSILMDSRKDTLYARAAFQCISDKPLKAMMAKLSCFDIWGEALGEPVSAQYLDLCTSRGSMFGLNIPIALPDKNIRKVQVTVQKVMFEDGALVEATGEQEPLPHCVPLAEYLGSQTLAGEYSRLSTPKARYAVSISGRYWQCTCGSINTADEAFCPQCSSDPQQLQALLNSEALAESLEQYQREQAEAAAQQAAREAQEKAEQEERIRQAEAQMKLEQEQFTQKLQEQPGKQKKKKKAAEASQDTPPKPRKRGKVLKIIAACVAGAVALACLVVFLGIPGFRYLQANKMLENGQFDEARAAFLALGDFFDSETKAQQALYDKAMALWEQDLYAKAIAIFQSIPDYEDAKNMALRCQYDHGLYRLERKEFDWAIAAFSGIPDYKDSQDMVKKCYYEQGLYLMDLGEFAAAAVSFEQIPRYEDAETLATECHYQDALLMLEQENFEEAYIILSSIVYYKDAKTQLNNCVYQWVDYIFDHCGSPAYGAGGSAVFKKTITLTNDQYETVYLKIWEFIESHTDWEFWCAGEYWNDGLYLSHNSEIVCNLLSAFPASYGDVGKLMELFADFRDGLPTSYTEDYILSNEELLSFMSPVGFVQDYLMDDSYITTFLLGTWKTGGGSYYLKFKYNEDTCNTWSYYSLPYPNAPRDAKYYDIRDGIWMWINDDSEEVKKVYKLTFIDYDTLEVYCYKNGRTYTLYRQ